MKIAQRVAVIGAGLAGLQIAALARRAGYAQVVLLEAREAPYLGASPVATKLHLGGQYPLCPRSAVDCLRGALVFKQMFPELVFDQPHDFKFMVTRDSARTVVGGDLSSVLARYRSLARAYGQCVEAHARLGRRPRAQVEAELFGPPAQLCRPTRAAELDGFGPNVGGFWAGERRLHTPRLAAFLLRLVRELGVELWTGAEVAEIEAARGGGRRLRLRDGRDLHADLCVGAAWAGNQELGLTRGGDRGLCSERRPMLLVDTAAIAPRFKTGTTFALVGASGGMFVPIDGELAHVSIQSTIEVAGASAALEGRPEFTASLNDAGEPALHELAAKVLEAGRRGPFPFLADAEPVALYARTALLSRERSTRTYRPPRELAPGQIVATPMKATHSSRAALDVLRLLLERSRAQGKVHERDCHELLGSIPLVALLVPPALRFVDAPAPDPLEVARYRERLAFPSRRLRPTLERGPTLGEAIHRQPFA